MQKNRDIHTAEELGQHSRETAKEIEREVAGVMVDNVNRNTFKIDYEVHLPPEVAEIARREGFYFAEAFGTVAKFERE